jgi:hypothetical protein
VLAYGSATETRRSDRAAEYTCREASRFIPKMPIPTIRSGHAERVAAVTAPAAMIATFARVSFRAERNAARVRLPLCVRTRASSTAQNRLMASAPYGHMERGGSRRHRVKYDSAYLGLHVVLPLCAITEATTASAESHSGVLLASGVIRQPPLPPTRERGR